MKQNYCVYYQAHIKKPATLGVVSILKSFDHVCFDRTLDAQAGLFEFFVPAEQEALFLKIMQHFEKEGIVRDIKKKVNRCEIA